MAWREEEFMRSLSGIARQDQSRQIRGRRTRATLKATRENAQSPTPNAQRPMRRTAKSFGVFLCCPNAGEENSDQLFAFCEDEDHVFLRKHFRFFKQAEPSPRLFQLFQANFQFVNEVFTRLGCFYFTVIAIWRSPTTKNLSGEMISRSRIRKSINQSNNPGAELKQSIFQVEARIRLSLGVRRWALSVGR